jgi:ribosomal protein L40E
MSTTPTLQCLFCNHLNPGGASFCNDCGSQMHLQPCDRCGAINKRTAKSCHKCDSSFTLPGTSAHGPALAPEPEGLHGQTERRATSTQLEESVTGFANTASPDQIGMTEETPQFYQLVTPQGDVQDIRSKGRPAWRLKALASVIAVSALAAYYYKPHLKPAAKEQLVESPAQSAPTTPVAVMTAAPTIAPPSDITQSHTSPAATRDTSKVSPDRTIAMAPPGAGPATPPILPPPMADTQARPTPPLLRECPEAVATLGICSQSTNPEKP